MRLEDMRPEARERVRRIRAKLCELAVGYKAVKPEACQACESPCEYGMEMLAALGMERPTRESEQKKQFHQDRRMRKIIKGINRRRKQ